MQGLVCFNYLSIDDPTEKFLTSVDNNSDVIRLCENLRDAMDHYTDLKTWINKISIDEVKVDILKLVNKCITSVNTDFSLSYYFIIDDIYTVDIVNNKASIMEDVNPKEAAQIRYSVEKLIYTLKQNDRIPMNITNYTDTIFMVVINIVPKNKPIAIIYPNTLDDKKWKIFDNYRGGRGIYEYGRDDDWDEDDDWDDGDWDEYNGWDDDDDEYD